MTTSNLLALCKAVTRMTLVYNKNATITSLEAYKQGRGAHDDAHLYGDSSSNRTCPAASISAHCAK